jgi:DNA-binding CsgD family transcriptional regulator
MPNYLDILRTRSTPGVLILDMNDNLMYSNTTALDCFPCLRQGKLPREISDLCRGFRDQPGAQAGPQKSGACLVVDRASGFPFSLRAFPIAERQREKALSLLMILVEKIVDRRLARLDFESLRHEYGLTRRETEVLGLVSKGLSNLEISGKLYISEHTVKDHIKKILSKMRLTSRAGIIASLLHPPGKKG